MVIMTTTKDCLNVLLHEAATRNQVDKVVKAIDQGADVNSHDGDTGWTALHRAAFSGYVDVAQVLLSHGARVDAVGVAAGPRQEPVGWTPLLAAYRCPEIIKLLLDAGAELNYQEPIEQRSVLHMACKRNHLGTVVALLKLGADRTLRDRKGNTPYATAVEFSALDAVNAWDHYVAAESAHATIVGANATELPRPL